MSFQRVFLLSKLATFLLFSFRAETAQVDDDVINNTLINAMNQMESTVKQRDSATNKTNEDSVSRRQKSQLLAKYSEVSDEELDYGDTEEMSRSEALFHNTNSQEVEDRERRAREAQQEVRTNKIISTFCQ